MTTAPTLRKSRTVQPVDPELITLALEQRFDLQAEAMQLMLSLSQGLTLWADRCWTYRPDDMRPPDPADWKRVPKLCLILAQLEAIKHTLLWQSASGHIEPLWCDLCHDAPSPGRPYLSSPCIDHDVAYSSSVSWLQLFGAS